MNDNCPLCEEPLGAERTTTGRDEVRYHSQCYSFPYRPLSQRLMRINLGQDTPTARDDNGKSLLKKSGSKVTEPADRKVILGAEGTKPGRPADVPGHAAGQKEGTKPGRPADVPGHAAGQKEGAKSMLATPVEKSAVPVDIHVSFDDEDLNRPEHPFDRCPSPAGPPSPASSVSSGSSVVSVQA